MSDLTRVFLSVRDDVARIKLSGSVAATPATPRNFAIRQPTFPRMQICGQLRFGSWSPTVAIAFRSPPKQKYGRSATSTIARAPESSTELTTRRSSRANCRSMAQFGRRSAHLDVRGLAITNRLIEWLNEVQSSCAILG
jgi:hypothetical protein